MILGLWGIMTYAIKVLHERRSHVAFWVGAAVFIIGLTELISPHTKPLLRGEVHAIMYGGEMLPPPQGAPIIFVVSVANIGTFPSGAGNWGATAIIDGKKYFGHTTLIPERLTASTVKGMPIVYFGKDNIAIKSLHAISEGDVVYGLLLVEFWGLPTTFFRDNPTTFYVSFDDVIGHHYEIQTSTDLVPGPEVYYPGIHQIPLMRIQRPAGANPSAKQTPK